MLNLNNGPFVHSFDYPAYPPYFAFSPVGYFRPSFPPNPFFPPRPFPGHYPTPAAGGQHSQLQHSIEPDSPTQAQHIEKECSNSEKDNEPGDETEGSASKGIHPALAQEEAIIRAIHLQEKKVETDRPATAPAASTTSTTHQPTEMTEPAVLPPIIKNTQEATFNLLDIIRDYNGQIQALMHKGLDRGFCLCGTVTPEQVQEIKRKLSEPAYLIILEADFINGSDQLVADLIATNPFIVELSILNSKIVVPIKIGSALESLRVSAFVGGTMAAFPDISEAKSLKRYRATGRWKQDFNDKIVIPNVCPLEYLDVCVKTAPDISQAIHLKQLISYSSSLKEPISLQNNDKLEYVEFSRCNEYRELPSFSHLKRLHTLLIYKMNQLEKLSPLPENVKVFIISDCPKLKTRPDLSRVKQFEKLIQDVPYYPDYYSNIGPPYPKSLDEKWTAVGKQSKKEPSSSSSSSSYIGRGGAKPKEDLKGSHRPQQQGGRGNVSSQASKRGNREKNPSLSNISSRGKGNKY